MSSWKVHYLNAGGQLNNLIDPIGKCIERARLKAEEVTSLIAIDVIVQSNPENVIEHMGFVGYAPNGMQMHLSIDPENEFLLDNLGEPFERMVVHELHHVLRWRGPGYGNTLGEALVSEGLAGHFCKQLYSSPPELWECAVPREKFSNYIQKISNEWDTPNYNHHEWFFGRGDLPRWLGYSLGYTLVGDYIKQNVGESAATLVNEPSTSFKNLLESLF
jgi:hypothetical protein